MIAQAARQVRGWTQQEDEDYDNEGHTYGADDQGGMFVSKTETTYELESASTADDAHVSGNVPDQTIQQVNY